jgi:hypothetical protein
MDILYTLQHNIQTSPEELHEAFGYVKKGGVGPEEDAPEEDAVAKHNV